MRMDERKIKFRAWDTINEAMVDDVYICRGSIEFGEKGYHANKDKYIFMQFTGLKDNAGVDIYEGDILKPKDYPKNYVVSFEDGAFVCRGGQIRIDPKDWWKRVIIGNIYENPELVKGRNL